MSESKQNSECPDLATLRALLDGTLPAEQQVATQAHVDRCPTCEIALRKMTAGGESWIGMAEKLKGGSESDPKLAAALDRLKADDGSGGDSIESTEPQRTLDFLQPADDPKLLGKLGQHEISEVVGWGGMGVVLKAYDPSLHRVVAVKVLASHLAHHAVARKRFIREAQAAAAVCHDNVVTIHAIEDGVADASRIGLPTRDASATLPKIIMQFVAGGSLQERIDQEGPLELKEVLRIALQTAAGLAAAHAQGVVHRDVKPANILLENGVQRVKLTDFGLARVMDDASLTLSGVIAGTPQYMAPEQAWGRDVDARADLFSLGAVMYAMCSGHSPFRARTTMAVLKRVCEAAPRPLRAINPEVPDWLVAIIEKLLAKNPDERFQSATEVSELLSRWLAHVQQPSVAERPEPSSARRGSLDPAASLDRRSPSFSQATNSGGDLRSRPGAGSGDPRTAQDHTTSEQIENLARERAAFDSGKSLLALNQLKQRPEEMRYRIRLWESALWALAAIGIPIMGVVAVFTPMGYGQALELATFGLLNVIATMILITVFRAAWKTTRWGIWLGSMFFLPAAGMGFLMLASDEPASGATRLVCGVQAVISLVFTLALIFSRPLLSGDSNSLPTERLSGWQRLFAVLLVTFIGTPLMFVVTYWLSHGTQPVVQRSQPNDNRAAYDYTSNNSASLLPDQPRMNSKSIPESAKPLLGRWVVVSSEGAPLGSPVIEGSMGFGAAGPSGMAGLMGGDGAMGAGLGSGGQSGHVAAPPLQWIEFADTHVVVFDGRETKLLCEFTEDNDQKQLTLWQDLYPGPNGSTDWRYGIYRLERDRLIICWTNGGRAPPTEFAADTTPGAQLLVLRREWSPPPNLLPPGETPPLPPRAVIPFTADEAKRFQDAWAGSANVPVETTNSLGMKLRLLPAGAFDSFQQQMLNSVSYHADGYVAGPAMPRPLYVATHEVTVAQFRKFVEATHYETSAEQTSSTLERPTWRTPGIVQDGDQHPVVQISWEDANAFCRWLSDSEQQSYRLPTLAEWAFVARAGLMAEARIKPATNARLKFFDTTAPVGGDTANRFGLHDLFGNVGEWTNHIAAVDEAVRRISLGGGFRNAMTDQGTGRGRQPIHHVTGWLMLRQGGDSAHFDDIGFRVVRELKSESQPPAASGTSVSPAQ